MVVNYMAEPAFPASQRSSMDRGTASLRATAVQPVVSGELMEVGA